MHKARLRRVLIALTAATLLLSGCGDEPDHSGLPAQAPAPAIRATPSTSAKSPEAAPEVTPETAKQVIRRWAALSNEIQRTGETTEFREMSKRCPACLGLADRVDEIYRRGGFIKTEGWEVLSVRLPPVREGRVDALVSVRSGATEYKESETGLIQRLSGARQDFRFVIRQKDDTWAVLEYHLVSA